MRIEEVASTTKSQRVATHTHIKGLGIGSDGTAQPHAAGNGHLPSFYHDRGAPHFFMFISTVPPLLCFLSQI